MNSLSLRISGTSFSADLSGAIYAPQSETLAVADLHFDKGSFYGVRGALLPPYDTRATLDRLRAVLARYRPKRVICLGDSFHDDDAPARMSADDAAELKAMTAAHDWIWVAGNHDPRPPHAVFGGRCMPKTEIDGIVFRHEADPTAPDGELSGHYHPKAAVPVRGRTVRGRCFVFDRRRAILPAFGAYTGGLDVRDDAIGSLFPDGFEIALLGGRRPYRLNDRQLGR